MLLLLLYVCMRRDKRLVIFIFYPAAARGFCELDQVKEVIQFIDIAGF